MKNVQERIVKFLKIILIISIIGIIFSFLYSFFAVLKENEFLKNTLGKNNLFFFMVVLYHMFILFLGILLGNVFELSYFSLGGKQMKNTQLLYDLEQFEELRYDIVDAKILNLCSFRKGVFELEGHFPKNSYSWNYASNLLQIYGQGGKQVFVHVKAQKKPHFLKIVLSYPRLANTIPEDERKKFIDARISVLELLDEKKDLIGKVHLDENLPMFSKEFVFYEDNGEIISMDKFIEKLKKLEIFNVSFLGIMKEFYNL